MKLGDMVKTATTKLGIKPCGGCEKRAELLNRLSLDGLKKAK